jgi:molybdenum cofactor cytidylyltransferase
MAAGDVPPRAEADTAPDAVVVGPVADTAMPKVLQLVGGRSMVARAAAAALACRSFAAVAVVVGADAESIECALRAELGPDAERLCVVRNPSPADGQASSLRLGVAALPTGCDPVVLLADQPWVTVETLARVVDAAATHPRAAGVGLSVEGVVGPPVLLHRSLRPQIDSLTGDTGARALLRRYPTRVVAVPALGDEASDIDDPGDLARARSAAAERGD